MSDAASILRVGLRAIAVAAGTRTATLTQAGVAYSLTGLAVLDESQVPAGGQKDLKRRAVLLPYAGITGAVPLAEARLVFTSGDDVTTSWLVESVDVVGPGDTVACWTLNLVDYDARP